VGIFLAINIKARKKKKNEIRRAMPSDEIILTYNSI
jgi:hypothetical protein